MSAPDESYLLNKQYRRVHASLWSVLVLLGMVVGFVAAWSFAGIITWVSPSSALFALLAVPALVATMFSIAMGGGRRKDEK